MVTRRPRLFSNRPSEDAVSPLPSELDTPPVTKMCLATGDHHTSRSRARSGSAGAPPTVEGAQRRNVVDDPAERDDLAQEVQSSHHHERGGTSRGREREHRTEADNPAERVGARVPEHEVLAQVGPE